MIMLRKESHESVVNGSNFSYISLVHSTHLKQIDLIIFQMDVGYEETCVRPWELTGQLNISSCMDEMSGF